MEDEGSAEDESEDEKEKEVKKRSLTEDDLVAIRSIVSELVTKSEVPATAIPEPALEEKSTLDIATDELYTSINKALSMSGVSFEQRLENINPALQGLGNAITDLVRKSAGQSTAIPASNEQTLILEALTALTNKMDTLSQEVALVKEKSQTPSTPVQARVPVPRSIAPQPIVNQSQTVQQNSNPNSVRNLVRRSVGIKD